MSTNIINNEIHPKGINPDNRYLKLLEPGYYEGLEIPGGHYNFMQDFKRKQTVRMSKMVDKLKADKIFSNEITEQSIEYEGGAKDITDSTRKAGVKVKGLFM